ncbi:hypothetical protein Ddye_028505 [Dipteronia dyeriana]|uniref:BED-type domain-containing protein n=1 Tax=Dipteronia dyeriana TaxID=168575 RepID=A0AAD9TDU1_9ROSI|nr:hypothetical protein Ddye_028505 [Dipteronia dyeriana]
MLGFGPNRDCGESRSARLKTSHKDDQSSSGGINNSRPGLSSQIDWIWSRNTSTVALTQEINRLTMVENSNAIIVEPSETLTTDEVLVSTNTGTKRKPTKTPLKVLIYFTKNEGGNRCTCKYCGKDYACGSKKIGIGSSTLWTHLNDQCKNYQNRLVDEKQKVLTFEKKNIGDGTGNLVAVRFRKDVCSKTLS